MEDWVKRVEDEFAEEISASRVFASDARQKLRSGNVSKALEEFRHAAHAVGQAEGMSEALYHAGYHSRGERPGAAKRREDRLQAAWDNVISLESQIDQKISL